MLYEVDSELPQYSYLEAVENCRHNKFHVFFFLQRVGGRNRAGENWRGYLMEESEKEIERESQRSRYID